MTLGGWSCRVLAISENSGTLSSFMLEEGWFHFKPWRDYWVLFFSRSESSMLGDFQALLRYFQYQEDCFLTKQPNLLWINSSCWTYISYTDPKNVHLYPCPQKSHTPRFLICSSGNGHQAVEAQAPCSCWHLPFFVQAKQSHFLQSSLTVLGLRPSPLIALRSMHSNVCPSVTSDPKWQPFLDVVWGWATAIGEPSPPLFWILCSYSCCLSWSQFLPFKFMSSYHDMHRIIYMIFQRTGISHM